MLNTQDLALLVKGAASERSKLFALRNDAPLCLEFELPEDVTAVMNVIGYFFLFSCFVLAPPASSSALLLRMFGGRRRSRRNGV